MANINQYANWCLKLINGEDLIIDDILDSLYDDNYIDNDQEWIGPDIEEEPGDQEDDNVDDWSIIDYED